MKWMYLCMFQINDCNDIVWIDFVWPQKSMAKNRKPPNKQGVWKVPKPVIS